jgi:4'-phosphopantetheinyl transferase EntD
MREELKMGNKDPTAMAALASLAPPGLMIGHRIIAPGDEDALLDGEIEAFKQSVPRVRRQSGAARLVAREILAALGVAAGALPRTRPGPPAWPRGIVGSLSHDDVIAVAAVARAEIYAGIGIDVEPPLPLPPELVERVTTAGERRWYPPSVLESRVLFATKEAIYKAQYPSDGVFLDFQDIEVDLEHNRGVTRTGRSVQIAVTAFPRIFALAFILRPRRLAIDREA